LSNISVDGAQPLWPEVIKKGVLPSIIHAGESINTYPTNVTEVVL
jgi:hypothetical protein